MIRQNRARKLTNLDIKKEIISKRESGKHVGDPSAECSMANGWFNEQHIFYCLFFIKESLLIIFTKEKFVYVFQIYMYNV